MDTKKAGILVLIGGLIAAIATFLTAFSVSVSAAGFSESQTESYINTDDGKLVIGLAIMIGIFGLMLLMRKATKAASILGLVFSILLLVVTFIDYSDSASTEEQILGELPAIEGIDFGVEASVGIAVYLAMAGAVLALIGSILALKARKNEPAEGMGSPAMGPPPLGGPGQTMGQVNPPPTGTMGSPPPPAGGMGNPPPGQGYPPPPSGPAGPSA